MDRKVSFTPHFGHR